jgi:TM2 domain-containing membrane protein YozV
MKDLMMGYFLCGVGLFTPIAGLHRFYLEKPISGVFYLLTWGFCGVGTLIDLIRMPTLIDNYNVRRLLAQADNSFAFRKNLSSPERAILKCAKDHDGVITVPMVTLASGLSMVDAERELNRLFKHGFCNKDVDEEGNEVYIFRGLEAKKTL